jgi:hypothetical protein
MIAVFLGDVGDGLAAGIKTISGCRVQVDCGSQQNIPDALKCALLHISPEVFILSHFHSDHYSGLYAIQLTQPRLLQIKEVLLPRFPTFPERDKFLRCLFAMNLRILGNTTGSMPMDLFDLIRRVNATPFRYKFLSKGDVFDARGSKFTVLWPPTNIDAKSTLKVIRKGIQDFDEAMEKDDKLKKIYDILNKSNKINPYLSGEPGEIESCVNDGPFERLPEKFAPEELSPIVKRANDSLRKAANHLSLAFHKDNRFLFFGDIESSEIAQVMKALEKTKMLDFQVMITPHHGTHWHQSMKKLSCCYALSSVGKRLFRKLKPEYKEIAKECRVTYLNGCLCIRTAKPFCCLYRTGCIEFLHDQATT